MIDHDNLEEFRDPESFDLEDEGYYDDWQLTEQWARTLGGPLLDLACGTGRMALRLAAQGYQVTGVDITPEMIEWARHKATKQATSIEWVVADARTFQLQKQFSFIYMLENVFQFSSCEKTSRQCWHVSGNICFQRDVFSLKHAIPPHAISWKCVIQVHKSTLYLLEGSS